MSSAADKLVLRPPERPPGHRRCATCADTGAVPDGRGGIDGCPVCHERAKAEWDAHLMGAAA